MREPLNGHDKLVMGTAGITSAVGALLVVIGFVFRFGRGFGEFVSAAEKHDDFLELRRLDMIFGLFTASGIVLLFMCSVAIIGILRRNSILLKMYAAVIALMILVQLVTGLLAFTYSDEVNQLVNNDKLYVTLNRTRDQWNPDEDNDDNRFWKVTQSNLKCCGVMGAKDWSLTLTPDQYQQLNCRAQNTGKGCAKMIRDRVSGDATYIAVAAMAVLLIEIIASFMAGWRAFTLNETK